MFLKIFKTFSFGIRRDLLHRTWPYKWVDARTLAKKHGLNWFREWFLYITPALVRTFLYITHNSLKIAAWVYIVWRTFVFLIFTLHVKFLKSLESSKSELLGLPKMTLGFMMNPNEPHWGSSWTPKFGASVTRKSSLWLIFPTENEQFLAGSKILDMTAPELPHDADLEIWIASGLTFWLKSNRFSHALGCEPLVQKIWNHPKRNFWIPRKWLWGSSWIPLGFIMNPKVCGIRDSKEFIRADFPDRKWIVSRRIQNHWHESIGTRAWRRSRDLNSFWAHFLIVVNPSSREPRNESQNAWIL